MLENFYNELSKKKSDQEVLDFCRKKMLNGTPYVFKDNDDGFYEFRKQIALKFNISFNDVYITGSGKLGFSPFKNKMFDYNSDIDVALVSEDLFNEIMVSISEYQWMYRKNKVAVSEKELKMYHEFLEYTALGWIRPDKLPTSFQMKTFKDDWFDYFRSISNGKSEVGNYAVNGGVFKSYQHLEKYSFIGFKQLKSSQNARGLHV